MPERPPKANDYAFGGLGLPYSFLNNKVFRCLVVLFVLPLLSVDVFAEQNNAAATQVPIVQRADSSGERLAGEVSKFADPPLDKHIDELMAVAVERTGKKETLDNEDKHFSKPVQKAFAWSKDLGELVTEYKGLEQSSEAADVILNAKVKLKSKAAVELAKQLQVDDIHRQIVSNVMQIAMGLGSADSQEGASIVDAGVGQLKNLVGEEQAGKTLQFLTDWSKLANQSTAIGKQSSWSILQLEGKSNEVLQAAIDKDPVMLDIKGKLNKYNHRSKFARVSAKFLNTTLSITALSPTLIAPASEVAWTAFVMLNGGPEESKLLKEVYLGQRFESRWKMLNEESRLAVNGYNMATLTQNAAMLSVSKFLIAKMSSDPTAEQLISASKIVPTK